MVSGDLHKRNSQIRELLKKLKLVETEALSTSSALDETRDQLNSLAQQHSQTCTQLHELEVCYIFHHVQVSVHWKGNPFLSVIQQPNKATRLSS